MSSESFEHAKSEAILDQCAVKQFHRLDGMDEQWAKEFGLNYAQMRFVQDAVPGNEDAGFSEALVDGEWRGITVEAMPKEKQVIDVDSTEQERSSLPGAENERSTTS
ncbi:hypothetical protein LT974_06365 [Halobacterium noricense]|nr:hypothetical protein [Halobacterium noricense]UHH26558.1 hypothetical protein LT974_06365 [Halobacterium noricense]